MLNYKVNKPKSKLSKLSNFICRNILYIPIIVIVLFIATYTYGSIYNNDITINKVDSVTSVDTNTMPTTTTMPRRTTLASRGEFIRGVDKRLGIEPVVSERSILEKEVDEEVDVDSVDDVVVTPMPTVEPTVAPTIKPTVKPTIKPVVKKVEKKVSDVGFDYIDSFTADVTAYTLHPSETGGKTKSSKGYGITASGKRVVEGTTIAASSKFKFGTRIRLEGFAHTFIVSDRGSAITGNKIDIFMNSRNSAFKFGRKKIKAYVLSYGKKK